MSSYRPRPYDAFYDAAYELLNKKPEKKEKKEKPKKSKFKWFKKSLNEQSTQESNLGSSDNTMENGK